MRNGDIIPGLSLNDSDPSAVLTKLWEMASDHFESCEMNNRNAVWKIIVGGFEGIDESGDALPAGYVRDTGLVVVGGNGIPAGGHDIAFVPQGVRCYATRVKVSATITTSDFAHSQPFHWQDAVCTPQEIAEGVFIDSVIVTLPASRLSTKSRVSVAAVKSIRPRKAS